MQEISDIDSLASHVARLIDVCESHLDEQEHERQRALDPIARTRAYLETAGVWSNQDEQSLLAICEEQVQEAVDAYKRAWGITDPPRDLFRAFGTKLR